MKHISITLLLVCASLLNVSAQSQDEGKELRGMVKVEVDGLSCPFCAYGLEKKLKGMEGVTNIKIDVENAFALLTIEDGKTVLEKVIRQRVKDAGFTAREIKEVGDEG